jgi:hypothetical protein
LGGAGSLLQRHGKRYELARSYASAGAKLFAGIRYEVK